MSHFIQIHMLTSYPPSNLNRDDSGRPKTAIMGTVPRLRISSQSLKRAWRCSSVWESALSGHIGIRTKDLGVAIYHAFINGVSLQDALQSYEAQGDLDRIEPEKARSFARTIAGVFGKIKSEDAKKSSKSEKQETDKEDFENLKIDQLAHISPEELAMVSELMETVRSTGEAPDEKSIEVMTERHTAVDIAMFGRMLAASPKYNTDAAVQVAHAITVHKAEVEEDFFSAVDDLNKGQEDKGAGHLGVHEFGAGLFYLYVCIDRDLLTKNLCDNSALTQSAIRAFVEAMATIAPGGMQNSYASRAAASFILAEKGTAQPRSLHTAFLAPIKNDILANAIHELEETRQKTDTTYGIENQSCSMNVNGDGTFADILDFVTAE